jgi:hypothetical protein
MPSQRSLFEDTPSGVLHSIFSSIGSRHLFRMRDSFLMLAIIAKLVERGNGFASWGYHISSG